MNRRSFRAGMSSRYYVTGPERAGRVRDLFNTVARRYDLINDVQSAGLHRYWKWRLIRLAEIRPGERVLDVCCGTGDLVFAANRRGGRVTGLDFSRPMLAVANGRGRDQGGGAAVRLVCGDALKLPFPDGSFDVATIAYGLRNLADVGGGLREFQRVLRPGGRMLALEFGKPGNRVLRRAYFGYLRRALPVFGWMFCGDAAAYAYILESLRHYPSQDMVSKMIDEAGFRDVRCIESVGGIMSLHRAEKL